MKQWKKIIRDCPYLVVLLITWLFMTAGGIALMIYRDYNSYRWETFWTNPFFTVIMEEEKSTVRNSYNVKSIGENINKIAHAIKSETESAMAAVMENSMDDEPEPAEEIIIGQTHFTTYTPVEIDSIYYSDAGKVALTTDYPYTTVGEDYFDDAVFFGDSRTLGISDYSGLNADFYCENGMTVFKLLDEKGVKSQETDDKVNLNQVLQEKKYGKIYIMLGMNELGYGNTEFFLNQYDSVLQQLRQWQPDAVIFLQANLHVSRQKDNPATEFNNININDKNAAIATLANGTDVFYLDINPLFTDNEGYLNDDLTFDGVHLYANGYIVWKNFLMEHGVVRGEN
ncbi:MAG: hypothetical protein J1E98_07500 [Lachnospiraceae bacterium]|nr:hypothetical protein [Lachnospiraceae bacterium]